MTSSASPTDRLVTAQEQDQTECSDSQLILFILNNLNATLMLYIIKLLSKVWKSQATRIVTKHVKFSACSPRSQHVPQAPRKWQYIMLDHYTLDFCMLKNLKKIHII